MSQFLTELRIESVGAEDGDRWKLIGALHYQSDRAKQVIMVPEGFETDLASTPRLPFVYLAAGNVAKKAAVVHDFLYSDGRMSRAECDAIFLEAAKATGVPWWQRWLMYAGVRLGGASHYGAPETA